MSVNDPKTWRTGDILSVKVLGATVTGPIRSAKFGDGVFMLGHLYVARDYATVDDLEYLSWERPKPDLTWGAVIQHQDTIGNVERLFYLPDDVRDTLPFTDGRGAWEGWDYLGPNWEVLLEGV